VSWTAATSFAATLLHTRFKDRTAFEAWQTKRIQTWLKDHVAKVPEYARIDCPQGLTPLPIVTKSDILDRFERFNRLGLDTPTAMAMADGAPAPKGYFVGASTGTTGPRQPYLISEAERQVWLGTILAKTLGPSAIRRPRVAVILPRGSALYDAAASRLPLRFIPITDGFAAMADQLTRFQPDVITAPPRALRWLAEQNTPISPQRLFSAAEVLDPLDRAAITTGFPKAQLGEIYMATEGLLAVTCRYGTLHLAEDRVHFELEPAGDGLVTPIISDFSRTAQIMARYRMNDLLKLGPPCPCGSSLRSVSQIHGRCDDVFDLGGVLVTPDILRNAIVADPGVTDFRVQQTGPARVEICLPPNAPSVAARVAAAIKRAGASAEVSERHRPITAPVDHKLRRVERVWKPS
jgi:putative adenylate-forming enzyme